MHRTKKLKPQPSQTAQSFLLESQIKSPERLKMLILSGSSLARNDFMFILQCKSLIKLDLSNNGLVRFPKEFSLAQLSSLAFLHLHNNEFRQIEDLKPVFQTTGLLHLTLHNNPLPMNSRIEHFILNVLRRLRVINDRVIFEEERLPDVMPTRPVRHLDLDTLLPQQANCDEKYYIWMLEVQFFCIDRGWADANPIVKVQRLWRRRQQQKLEREKRPFKYTRKFKDPRTDELRNPGLPLLANCFDMWKEHVKSLKKIRKHLKKEEKLFMTLPLHDYSTHRRNERVSHIVSQLMTRIRYRIKVKKAIEVFVKRLKPRVLAFESARSFYAVSEIQETGRIMFGKIQKHLLLNFLEHVKRSLPGRNLEYTITNCISYVSVRLLEEERLRNKKGSGLYSQFLYPSMCCVFLRNRKSSIKKTKRTAVPIQQLSYLTKKNGRITQQERKRSRVKYDQLNKYISNEYYNSLMEFRCKDAVVFKQLLRFIYYHNTKSCHLAKYVENVDALAFLDNYDENFVFYVDSVLKRSTAAVLIQKCWKRYWNNKTSKQTLYTMIARTRAAQKLQRFARSQQFSHRVSFDNNLNAYIRELNFPVVYLQLEIYKDLKGFLRKRDLYNKLALWVNHTKKDVLLTWEHPKNPFFPLTMKKLLQTYLDADDKVQSTDIYNVLHYQADVSMISVSGVPKYVRFEYPTLEVARKRAAYLALLTYQYKIGVFLRVFTKEMLEDSIYVERYSQRLRQVYVVTLPPWEKQVLKETPIVLTAPMIGLADPSRPLEYEQLVIPVQYFQQDNLNSQPNKVKQKLVVQLPKAQIRRSEAESKTFIPRLQDIQSSKIVPEGQPSQLKKNISNLRKNFEKRLSFYDITIEHDKDKDAKKFRNKSHSKGSVQSNTPDNPPSHREAEKPEEEPASPQSSLNQTDYLRQTQKVIQQQREEHSTRMMIVSEREKMYLSKVRKLYTHEKNRNLSNKLAQESEEMAVNRLKVEKIDEMAKEMRQTRTAQQQHEGSFLQKGNFLIKQEAKMQRIRQTYHQEQRKKDNVNKMTTSRRASHFIQQPIQTRNFGSRVSVSEEKNHELDRHGSLLEQFPEGGRTVPVVIERAPSLDAHQNNQSQLNASQIPSMQNILPAPFSEDYAQLARLVRKKEKIIHAVFPEQFYAIDKRSTNIFLPRLDK